MVSLANLSREERIGLLIAGTAHVALAVVLMLQDNALEPIAPPQRITVSLAEEVALETASPDPSADPAAALAPELAPVFEPEVLEPPRPTSRVAQTPRPRPIASPTRRPTPTPSASRRPSPTPSPTRSAGGQRVSAESMRGLTDADGMQGTTGDRPSEQQRASIQSEINRQLRPHWLRNIPQGPDVELLVTTVRFRLNRDGSLDGMPQALGSSGTNATNRAQVARHQEAAIRSVRLAAPFTLPARFYSVWDDVEIDFDYRLAQ